MRAHAVWQFIASWLLSLLFALGASLLTLLTLGLFARRLTPWILRTWGRLMLRVAGVTWDVEGLEHLHRDEMKIVPFNHGSFLDACLVTAVMPPGSVAAIKREALFIPVVGVALVLLGFLLIDRGNSQRAHRTMKRAAARMAKDRLSVFVAPEGTRTETGDLLPFKKGVLHLALASGAPIVPMLIDGAYDVHPPGRLFTQPGHIAIRFLPPRAVQGLTLDSIAAETEALRALYVTELARLHAERGAGRTRLPTG